MPLDERIIAELIDAFNERRPEHAVAMFTPDAVLQGDQLGREQRGPDGYHHFVGIWLAAFPDAVLTIERVARRDGAFEVDLLAHGTHVGVLELVGYGLFKPSGVRATLKMRVLIELRGDRIAFASFSLDIQEIVQQLVRVDIPRLRERLQRIQQLAAKLEATPSADVVEQRLIVDRLGRELDEARRIIRPYFAR